ncbi:MAG: hypothetical protein GY696_07685 [Gammaproteobacteria bacterium]|nr:hypothetical protein [Gammaproteobacteria bacterium]
MSFISFQIAAGSRTTRQQQEASELRRKQEIRFFIQSCINAAVYEYELISFHGFSRLATEKWGWFFTTTLIWMISHGCNGFLMIFCNPPLRRGMATVSNMDFIYCT